MSAGLTVILVTFSVQAIGSVSSIWQRTEVRTDAFREARAALGIVSRDLRCTINHPRSTAGETVPFLTLKRLYVDPASQAEANMQIYALITQRNGGRSDVCSVGYYSFWEPSRRCYVLKRYYQDSDATFDNVKLARSRRLLQEIKPEDIFFPAQTPQPRSGSAAAHPIEDEVVASYVWDLKIECLDADTNSQVRYPVVFSKSPSKP